MTENTAPSRRSKRVESDPIYDPAAPMPHNPEMERAVIAAILTEPDYCVGKAVELLKTEGAFYVPAYRHIFRVVLDLFNGGSKSPIDPLTIANKLRLGGQLEALGGEPFLADIQSSIATTANFEAWASTVNDYYVLRKMIQTCTDSIQRCHTLTDNYGRALAPMTAVDAIESEVLKVRSHMHQQNVLAFKDVASNTFRRIGQILRGEIEPAIPTGFADLDHKIQGGLKKGEMFVLAARPSIGKTSFALNIIRNILMHGKRVAFFSLEMTDEQIARRLLCNVAKVSESELIPHAERISSINQKLTRAMSQIENWPLFLDPTPALRVMELRAKAHRLKQEQKIDVIVIDYLQLMRGSGNPESRQQEVSEISSGIKALAKELDVPIMALAQLSRESEKSTDPKQNPRPKLSHLRESGAIEQDADIVAFLHRDRDKQKVDASNPGEGLPAECIVEKNRNGETGYIQLLFVPSFTDFRCKTPYGKVDEPR